MWTYLNQFWDSVAEVVVSGGTYTIDWFKAIGNAVAGAIGGLFDWLLHYINDFFVFLGYLGKNLESLIDIFLIPFKYIFSFISQFLRTATLSPILPLGADIWDFKTLFSQVPILAFADTIVGLFLLAVLGFGILKSLKSL